jgi:hypothetical protein
MNRVGRRAKRRRPGVYLAIGVVAFCVAVGGLGLHLERGQSKQVEPCADFSIHGRAATLPAARSDLTRAVNYVILTEASRKVSNTRMEP